MVFNKKEYQKRWRERKGEAFLKKEKKRKRKWYILNKNKKGYKEHNRAYRQENKEKYKKCGERWRQKNI